MFDTYNTFKSSIPGDALLCLAVFAGATVHALRNEKVPVIQGLVGSLISMLSGGFLTLIVCYAFSLDLKAVWFFGFPSAYLSNYILGGMDTVGAQIRDSPVQTIVSLLGTLADEIMSKIERFKPKK